MSLRWSEDQYADFLSKSAGSVPGAEANPPKKQKYSNQKVVTPDGTFDSKWEYDCWCKLKMLQAGGVISDLQRQVAFELIPAAKIDDRQLPPVRYIADFVYTKDGLQVVEDAKGMASLPDYKIKRRLMWWIHKIKVVEVRKK